MTDEAREIQVLITRSTTLQLHENRLTVGSHSGHHASESNSFVCEVSACGKAAFTPPITNSLHKVLARGRGEPPNHATISYLHLLWAEIAQGVLIIDYTQESHRGAFVTRKISCSLLEENLDAANLWVEKLLTHARCGPKWQKRIILFVNPHAGPGNAEKICSDLVLPILVAARCEVELHTTEYSGHAGSILQKKLDLDAWDMVACCSGDGLPHEAINGMARRPDAARVLRSTAVVLLPCGSGNGMCVSLLGTTNPSIAAIYMLKGVPVHMDLASVTQNSGRSLSFLSQNLGMIAECDLKTERLRFLGRHRFTVGLIQRILKPPLYPCDIAICSAAPDDNGSAIGSADANDSTQNGLPSLRFGTVGAPLPPDWVITEHDILNTFFAGNFPFMDESSQLFPQAQIDDGFVDIVRFRSNMSPVSILKIMSKVKDGSYVNEKKVEYCKAVAYRVTPRRKDGSLSIDGEKFPFAAFQVEVHKKLGLTIGRPDIV